MVKKRSISLFTLIALIAIIFSACSTKKEAVKKNTYSTEDYALLSKSDKKNVDITLIAKQNKEKVIFDIKIKNATSKAVEFDPNEFELNVTDVATLTLQKFTVKPKKTKILKRLFIVSSLKNFREVPKLTYAGNEISQVKLKSEDNKLSEILLNPKVEDAMPKTENQVEQSATDTTNDDTKNINSVTDADWTPGIPQEITGKYVSVLEPGDNFKWDLILQDNKMSMIPHAQTDSFGLDKVQYVKLGKNQYMLKGQALIYTTFYYRVTLKDDGNILTALSQDTPDNFGSDSLYERQ